MNLEEFEEREDFELTPEKVTEMGKSWWPIYLSQLSVEERLAGLSIEERLSELSSEEKIKAVAVYLQQQRNHSASPKP
jgi:hypothetical protein